MSHHNEIEEFLRERRLRLTPQRLLILSAIADGEGHLGVDEVYRKVKESYPYIDIATVYRTIHLLKKLGLVTEVGIGDRLHYELTDPNRKHHHLVCASCENAFDLDPSYVEEFRQTLSTRYNFEPDFENFTVSGLCAECKRKEPGD
jgi:Fur family transcriptional regulator, ferric uptake regulator